MSEEHLHALEARIRVLEDTAEIYRLMASYGPSVDSDSREEDGGIWTEDGVYDVDGPPRVWSSRTEIEEMLSGELHQGYLSNGCSHQVSAPRVTINGDTAVATAYMSLIERAGPGAYIIRGQTANRWEFVRTPDGWRVKYRTNRLLDGSQGAKDLLRRGIGD